MQPLDVVKTRFQIQTKKIPGDPNYYNSVFDCLRKMAKNEGFFSLYKGILPPILVETPKRALKTYFMAGLGAGVTESFLCNPFEVVKVAQQANKSQHTVAPSSWEVTKQIVRADGLGLRGLNKGLTATIGRNGTFNMVYFGIFHTVNSKIVQPKDKLQQNFQKFLIGVVGGVVGSTLNIPFDVAKSRIQGPQPEPGKIKYRTTFGSILIVFKEEGFLALYKGLVPKVLRLGPGAGESETKE
ncbi:Mitochondrial 2-oxodicarboxylate carrier [Armadillidium vulgare]|nr:Mitochondrial 2-oxodicarboxylate carrier [Armadillidium vulgare]